MRACLLPMLCCVVAPSTSAAALPARRLNRLDAPGAMQRCSPAALPFLLQGDVSACSGEVLAAGDAVAHQQALELLGWQ